jgi:hypothetical protein
LARCCCCPFSGGQESAISPEPSAISGFGSIHQTIASRNEARDSCALREPFHFALAGLPQTRFELL